MPPSTFVHLSDIHFRQDANTPYDAFKDLRNELERDIVALGEEIGGVNAVLISGDIAFSGASAEYKIAREWLQRLTTKLACPLENVWVTPGNHDVDRNAIKKSMLLRDVHRNLRKDEGDLDQKLAQYLGADPQAAALIYQPIQNYVDFASTYGCYISPDAPYWEHDWPLAEGFVLRFRGVNSTLISDDLDSDASGKLVVGKHQVELTRQDGVEYLVLCHHPPTWLVDGDSVEDLLNSRARLHLFGHKHRQRILQIGAGVRIAAGAMHPDVREPNWQPRFNVLQLSLERDIDNRFALQVRIYARVYNAEQTKFLPDYDEDGCPYREYRWPLDWKPPASGSGGKPENKTTKYQPTNDMDRGRKLTYQFLSLPHHTKLQIAQNLGIVRDEDEGVRDSALFRRYFDRLAREGKLGDLWQAVQKAVGDPNQVNPYDDDSGAR